MTEFFERAREILSSTYLMWIRDLLDVGLVSYFIYRILLLIKGTRAVQLIKGLLVLFIAYYIVNYFLQLRTMAWIMQNAATLIIIAIPIVFQPELRRLLAHIGQERILVESFFGKGKELFDFINIMVLSVKNLSQKKTGALIIIERSTGLNEFIETGIKIDASLSPEVIGTIFYSGTPLHDGAIVIKDNRIIAACVLLPLSENLKPISGKHNLGTRHRAGLGLSETSDAICIIVSEETGDISVAIHGKLYRHLSEESLEKLLIDIYQTKQNVTVDLPDMIKNPDINKTIAKKDGERDISDTVQKKNVNFNSFFQRQNLNLKIIAIITAVVFMFLLGKGVPLDNSERTFVLPVELRYKGQDKELMSKVRITPSYIKLKVLGTSKSIEVLSIEDLSVSVNLEKVEDNQKVPVNVSVPSNVTIKEVNPKDVLINIYTK